LYIDSDVLSEARNRVSATFDEFEKVYVSFSGGKDSTVMLDIVATEARLRGRRFGLLFVDLEAQYTATIAFAESRFAAYADVADPFWVALPLSLRNAVSVLEHKWTCWDHRAKDRWVRNPPHFAITDESHYDWFRHGMEFEDFIVEWAKWYSGRCFTACLVGIRTDESINRFRTIMSDTKGTHGGKPWSTQVPGTNVYNVYPIYDWSTADIWTYHAKMRVPYNPVYDMMHAAGLSPSQMRICQPYGDDQRRGLWLYHVLEPDTWTRVVARVAGANFGAESSRARGNINGVGRVQLPEGHTWQSYATMLVESMPPHMAEHYRTKIGVFLRWYADKGGYADGIPDEADRTDEAEKRAPSWRRVCKAILRNDYWCKSLGFSQHKSGAYESYLQRMRDRRMQWATS
jgi:predicted phosphoadenosine phosphosulfate sulfurtransferase